MSRSLSAKTIKRKEEPRIEIRTDHEIKATIQKAASLTGDSLSSFVISNSLEAARKILAEQERITLNDEARDMFLAMMANPPEPNEAFVRAARHYKSTR